MNQKETILAGERWEEKPVNEFPGGLFDRIGEDWMLITCGDTSNAASQRGNWNTMTASWGGLGVLWGKDVAFIFIRPCRHTFGFVNSASLFSLSFFDESKREALKICGEQSGRDIDKATVSNLTPVVFDGGTANGAIGFKEAREIIICRKLYTHDFDPGKFLDSPGTEKHYPNKDYHRVFIGEIISVKTR